MNANAIAKLILDVIGRQPCPDVCPYLRLYIPFETAPLVFPALIASVSLSAREPAGNATAEIDARFELALDAEDFSSAAAEALAEAVSDALAARLTPANLNAAAAARDIKAQIYFFRWQSTEAPSVSTEGKLVFAQSFTGAAQF